MQLGRYRFDRMELAGSLGDLGTLLPLAVGMIMVNGLDPRGLFFAVGLYYIIAGHYYGVPVAVQPMKSIGGYAVATGVGTGSVSAACLIMGLGMLAVGRWNLAEALRRHIPQAVIRGVQASTGVLLATQGVRFMLGTHSLQQQLSEPFLGLGGLGPVPWSLILGLAFLTCALLLLNNPRFPAALVVVGSGLLLGLVFSDATFSFGLHLPRLLPLGLPSLADFAYALPVLVMPQLPMTLGNAVIANADLSHTYFPESSSRVTPRSLCYSMGAACTGAFLLGGMPMCHGAGGLAAHYRFGARTCGSNLIIGAVFVLFSVMLGAGMLDAVRLLPLAVLGTLLLLAGLELCLTVRDVLDRSGLFVVFCMLTLTLTTNLAVSFVAGTALALLMARGRITL
jgi:SulP family sulfate permease